jgi:hypothetical protein
MTLDEFTQTLDPTQRMVQSNFGMEGKNGSEQPSWRHAKTKRVENANFPFGSYRVVYLMIRNLYIGINLNQPYSCLIKVAACNSQSQQTYNNSLEP